MSKAAEASGGIGFLGMLAIAFIVLRLCKVIDWSWWYVTLPLWGPFALFLSIVVILIGCFVIQRGFVLLVGGYR